MAPEQTRRGRDIGPWTDIWALGLVAYTLLVGKEYWQAETMYALHEPRSRRVAHGDASSRSWMFDQREAVCSGGGRGGGTVTGPTSISSSRSESRARVARQYLGASSR